MPLTALSTSNANPAEKPYKLADGGGSRFVSPGRNRDKPISNSTMLFALYRMGYKGKMTGHGFRAVASTALNEMGFRPDVIERQLAHCERNEIRGAYNRAEYIKDRQAMMQSWPEYLEEVANGAKVLPFKGGGASWRRESALFFPLQLSLVYKSPGMVDKKTIKGV